MKKDLSKLVTPTLDSNTSDDRDFLEAKVWTETIEGEVNPPIVPKCFLGAWYRKVFSSKDYWLGIEGTITLGEFIPDEKRFGYDNRVSYKRYLDSPSIYMGGFSLTESDAGLGLMSGYEYENQDIEINYGTPKIAYRPFWRYIYSEVVDVAGNVERNNVNSWNTSDPRHFDFYYFPGDKIKMSVYAPIKNYLQLRIELIEKTKIEKYVKIRNRFNLKRHNRTFYSPLFYSEGHGDNKVAEFKRVNSIDQYGNEGFVVSETKAKVTKAVWESVYLYREIDGEIYKVPFDEKRQTNMACPNKETFKIKTLKNGGEEITIEPVPLKRNDKE